MSVMVSASDSARKKMVEGQIMPVGVVCEEILNRFLSIPREEFVPANLRGNACCDLDLPIEGGLILSPGLHARLIDAAAPEKTDVVLDIGGGGYGPALLSGLVDRVVALESQVACLERDRLLWEKTGCKNVIGICANPRAGCPERGPFSLIVLNGAIATIPQALLDQLSGGGRLVAVVRESENTPGRAVLVRRGKTGNSWSRRELFDACCPWVSGWAADKPFVF